MSKEVIKRITSWLEKASDEQIELVRHAFVEARVGKAAPRTAQDNIRLAIRLIDEEILARRRLKSLSDRTG